MKIFKAFLEKFNKLKIFVDDFTQFRPYNFQIQNGNSQLSIKNYSIVENDIMLTLTEEVNIKNSCFLNYEYLSEKVWFFPLFSTEEFDDKFYHDLTLGAIYNKNYTIFRIWSPAASNINLLLYDTAESSDSENLRRFVMKENNGLWSILIKEDLQGSYYNYEVNVYNDISEIVDPYVKAVGINGLRGAIIDIGKTNPEGWEHDRSPELKNYTDAIIYETSIRDISTHPHSGVKHKGKFLALTEENTLSNNKIPTCLNHIKELGVTHIQFMPIFDFSYTSVDEKNPYSYNWGYDPQNYNVPEGSYSTNPYDPSYRIFELKKMIFYIHKNNLSINMDVVYNHVADAISSSFKKVFPGYYFRFLDNTNLSNGSGCGNDTASEHSMMRKFIVDSVMYWAKEYHIDGFRFDLMGLHDIDTMNSIRKKLDELKRPIMLYGEGWDLNTPLARNIKAIDSNSKKLSPIGFFNDKIRDCVKGSVFDIEDKGFATGKFFMENILKKSISSYFLLPSQSINYVSCHDNYTLWDKIDLSCKYESFDDKKRIVKLCASIILASQGIPFIYSGEEFCRTKNGDHNSYNKPDNINWLDWDRKSDFMDVFYYYQKLIHIRKNHPAFRMIKIEDIEKNLTFVENTPNNTVAFTIKNNANGDTWKDILVLLNANKENITLTIPEGPWNIALDSNSDVNNEIVLGPTIVMNKISSCILFKL